MQPYDLEHGIVTRSDTRMNALQRHMNGILDFAHLGNILSRSLQKHQRIINTEAHDLLLRICKTTSQLFLNKKLFTGASYAKVLDVIATNMYKLYKLVGLDLLEKKWFKKCFKYAVDTGELAVYLGQIDSATDLNQLNAPKSKHLENFFTASDEFLQNLIKVHAALSVQEEIPRICDYDEDATCLFDYASNLTVDLKYVFWRCVMTEATKDSKWRKEVLEWKEKDKYVESKYPGKCDHTGDLVDIMQKLVGEFGLQ